MAMTAERKAERKATRDYEKRMKALRPIADTVQISERGNLAVVLDGVTLVGNRDNMGAFNGALEKLGFRPVRITRNMLNPKAGEWCIDINTPAYCDPGCESYHTM